MEKVLVSSCLLGEPVRYDGASAPCRHPILERWRREGRIIPCCPEVAAGLGTPRSPVELFGGDGQALLGDGARALGLRGEDATIAFLAGAGLALALCRTSGIRLAVLKEQSPSCGTSRVYDGTFSGRLVPGMGATAALFQQHGISVYSEEQWELAEACLSRLERP